MAERHDLEKVLRDLRNAMADRWRRFWLTRKAKWGDFRTHSAYLEAQQFRKDFTPQDGVKYDWVDGYAKDTYDRLMRLFDGLDEKADSIIKYLGGGTALIALGSLIAIRRENALLILLLLPSVFSALRAIFLASAARVPVEIPMPPRVNEAIRYAESYAEKASDTFIAHWHECCEGLDVMVRKKGDQVHQATRWYYRALFLLLIPLILWPALKLIFGDLNSPIH